MSISPIYNNKQTSTKIKSICLSGMTTGASVFLTSSAINILMSESAKHTKDISQIFKKTAKLGLGTASISALACLGAILYEKA